MAEKKKLVSYIDAVSLANAAFSNDPSVSGRDIVSKGTLCNWVSQKKIKVYGPRHFRQVDINEVLFHLRLARSA